MLILSLTAYSCATKCVTEPPPGGFTYDEGEGSGRDEGGK
jgi:hypothetical protein